MDISNLVTKIEVASYFLGRIHINENVGAELQRLAKKHEEKWPQEAVEACRALASTRIRHAQKARRRLTGQLVESKAAIIKLGELEGQLGQAVTILEEALAAYSYSVFPDLPPGEHGKTVDACSAAALRGVLPGLIASVRALNPMDDK